MGQRNELSIALRLSFKRIDELRQKLDANQQETAKLTEKMKELDMLYHAYKEQTRRKKDEMQQTIMQLTGENTRLSDGEKLLMCIICNVQCSSGEFGVFACGHGCCFACGRQIR